jgi:hypothetical protein
MVPVTGRKSSLAMSFIQDNLKMPGHSLVEENYRKWVMLILKHNPDKADLSAWNFALFTFADSDWRVRW